MPAHKKHPSTRARRNKTSTRATLTRVEKSTPATGDYTDMTVAALKNEIDARNVGRLDEAKLSKRGTKASLVAALVEDDDDSPQLPARVQGWHEMTRRWWADIWDSPMSDEWDDSDLHNLFLCAMSYDDSWTAETAKQRKDAAGEFRLQRKDLGLSPAARRSLEWSIENAEDAKARGKQRRTNGSEKKPTPGGKGGRPDPRAGLHAVS